MLPVAHDTTIRHLRCRIPLSKVSNVRCHKILDWDKVCNMYTTQILLSKVVSSTPLMHHTHTSEPTSLITSKTSIMKFATEGKGRLFKWEGPISNPPHTCQLTRAETTNSIPNSDTLSPVVLTTYAPKISLSYSRRYYASVLCVTCLDY